MNITLLGHASILVELPDKRIYIDPYALKEDSKPADLILITHEHYDHCDINSIKKIRKPCTHIIGPESITQKIPESGILRAGDAVRIEDINIKAVPSNNIRKPFHPIGQGIGYVLEVEGKKIYHAGDTDLLPEMDKLKDIDIALLPVGGTYTMDADEAVEAVKRIKPYIAVPIHYGKIIGSRADADRFKKRVEEETQTRAEILENRILEI